MSIKTLYSIMDRLNDLITELEKQMKGTMIKVEGLNLSMERYNGQMRLLWNGKPVCECNAEDKINAMEHIDKLLSAKEKITSELMIRAELVCKKLEQINAIQDAN